MAAVVLGKGGVHEAPPVIYIKGNSISRKQLSLWLSFSGKHILHSIAKICNSSDYNTVIDQ